MKRKALVLSTVGAAMAGILAVVATPAPADELDQLSCLTFSGPFELPNVALPAGSYLFKLGDPTLDRHIVQVLTGDGKQVLGTYLTIPEQRLKRSDKTVVTFKEMPAGTPEAVKAWFYPDERAGNEFVYPREKAIQIAKATNQSVLSTSSSLSNATEMHKASVARVTGTGETETTPDVIPTSGMKSLKTATKSSALAPCTGR
jgi:hypothetical protein